MKLEGRSRWKRGGDAYWLGLEASKGDMNKTQGTLTTLVRGVIRVVSSGPFPLVQLHCVSPSAEDPTTLAERIAYLAPDLVVVQVHQGPGVLLDLPRVDEHLGEAQAVADVGRAAAPLPALVDAVEALLLLVAAAVAQVALRAGGRDGVGHARRDDGVREGGLFAAWQERAGQRRGKGPISRASRASGEIGGAGLQNIFSDQIGRKRWIMINDASARAAVSLAHESMGCGVFVTRPGNCPALEPKWPPRV